IHFYYYLISEGNSKQTAHPDIERLRSKIDLQAKAIDSLSESVAILKAERTQTGSVLSYLQAELLDVARQLKGQCLEERFEALRCEVTTELHYLPSLLLPSPGLDPCCPSASCSRLHPTEICNQAAINHISQKLYHSQRILWEQIRELREAVHRIQRQLGKFGFATCLALRYDYFLNSTTLLNLVYFDSTAPLSLKGIAH
ncbi:hypothetical protein NFI96_029936, partial [Prochilodus magdalenae]